MLRSERLKKISSEYFEGHRGIDLPKKKREEISDYLMEQATILAEGGTTPGFKDGDVEVCSGCGMPLTSGCGSECNTLECGMTFVERVMKHHTNG